MFASSVKAVGESNESPWTEDAVPHPADPYGRSKLEAERRVREAARRHGVHATILRLPLVYGPGMKANALRLFQLVDRGTPLPLGLIHNRRSLLYTGNLTAALIAAMECPAGGETFFVSDDEDLSTPQLVRAIARALGRPARLVPIPVRGAQGGRSSRRPRFPSGGLSAHDGCHRSAHRLADGGLLQAEANRRLRPTLYRRGRHERDRPVVSPPREQRGAMSHFVAIGAGAFIVSAALSEAVRLYALKRSLLDLPNERSLHSSPTPRGGGLAIVLVVIGGLALMAAAGLLSAPVAIAFIGGGALVGLVGWLDDNTAHFRRDPLFNPRGGQYLGRLVARGECHISLPAREGRTSGSGARLLAVAALIWAINLYNFMDGIDGLASAQAVATGLLGAVLVAPRSPALASISLLVAAAAAGFLPWNWSPARIFLGDVGSGFLGFMFGALAVADRAGRHFTLAGMGHPAWRVLCHATLTLVRRMIRGRALVFCRTGPMRTSARYRRDGRMPKSPSLYCVWTWDLGCWPGSQGSRPELLPLVVVAVAIGLGWAYRSSFAGFQHPPRP